MVKQLILDMAYPLQCGVCGSTAQIRLTKCKMDHNKNVHEYTCGCGGKIVVTAAVTSIEYWSERPNPTLIKKL